MQAPEQTVTCHIAERSSSELLFVAFGQAQDFPDFLAESNLASRDFKQGELIINDGEIVSNGNKRTLWVNVKTNENAQVERDIALKFNKFYTVNQKNYEVYAHHYVPNPYVFEIDATQ